MRPRLLAKVVLALFFVSSVHLLLGQITPPTVHDRTIVLTPTPPGAAQTASVDVFACAHPAGPSLLEGGKQVPVLGGKKIVLPLAKPLKGGDQVCTIETFANVAGAAAVPAPITYQVTVPNSSAASVAELSAPKIQWAYDKESVISVLPIAPPPAYTASMSLYSACSAGAVPAGKALPADPAFQVPVISSGDPVTLETTTALAKGTTICAVETYTPKIVGDPALPPSPPSPPYTVQVMPSAPSSKPPAETFAIAGVSLAAASGANAQGKLFAEIYGDTPFNQRFWGWGYLRVGSVSESTAALTTSEAGAAATTALSSQNQQLVQSIEFEVGTEVRILPLFASAYHPKDPASFSWIVDGGAITPLSTATVQQSQQYYSVTPSVQSFYTANAYAQYLSNFEKVCPSSINAIDTSTNSACYVDFYPQDRSRFFRHYESGFRIKVPGAQGAFPSTFDGVVGQNEYVSGGMMRGLVLHLGGASPLLPGSDNATVKGMFIYGSMDLGVTGHGDSPGPLLFAASTSATPPPSASTAVDIVVPQPNRDRWILGIGFDLVTLIGKGSTAPATTP